jgi:hypothetical protein
VAESRTAHPAHLNPRASRRAAALLCAMTILFSLLGEASVRRASAATPSLLLGRPGAGEYQPVEGDEFIAWQQNSRAHPRHYDVYARPLGGGEKFKVNAPSTNGANGEIDGDRLVYQQFKRGASDLKFFDLSSKGRSNPPRRVNTDQWEYWPSLSGRWLLFGRLYASGTRRIILFDLSTNTARQGETRPGVPRAGSGERGLRRVEQLPVRPQVRRRAVPHPRRREQNDPQPDRAAARALGG